MRFEIRAGGLFAIGVGLAGLSGIVFALGLSTGYHMGELTSAETIQTPSVYPLPNPPPVSDVSTAAKASEGIEPASTPGQTLKPAPKVTERSIATNPSSATVSANAAPAGVASRRAVANAGASVASPAKSAGAVAASDEGEEEASPSETASSSANPKYASASVSSPGRHKPFNIQIDAMMDHSSADQMASRLQKLGYHAFLVPTDLEGQTWWRVRIGPYQTQEEASAAEQELRAKYQKTYAP